MPRVPSRAAAALLACCAAAAAAGLTSAPALAAPAATAELEPVSTTWTSPTPQDLTSAGATGVLTFGAKTWIVGNLAHGGQIGPDKQAVVQQCTGVTCSMSVLPGRTGTYAKSTRHFGPYVTGITGTSATDLWAYGFLHSGNNQTVPQFWHNDGTGWTKVWEAGIVGEASVEQLVISPTGERWAIVHEDFDGIASVLYRRVGSTWTQVSSLAAPVFSGPCNLYPDSWYDNAWDDLVFVAGEPVVVGQCDGRTSVIFKRSGTAWRRIDPGLSTVARWRNAAVVDGQLWVQGDSQDRATLTILKRANGVWVSVPTTGIPAGAQISEMAGTLSANLWLTGSVKGSDGVTRPYAWRWTGTSWRTITAPAPTGGSVATLTALSAAGTTPAWITGLGVTSQGTYVPLAFRER